MLFFCQHFPEGLNVASYLLQCEKPVVALVVQINLSMQVYLTITRIEHGINHAQHVHRDETRSEDGREREFFSLRLSCEKREHVDKGLNRLIAISKSKWTLLS